MLRKIIHWIAARRPKRTIEIEGDEYLRRYYLFGRFVDQYFEGKPLLGFLPFSVYLHHFIRPDRDRELHNHPWDRSVSVILSGGYDEERLVGHTFNGHEVRGGDVLEEDYWPGTINVIEADDFHRVAKLRDDVETWTLFITGRKVQTWGFRLNDGKFMNWRDFVGVASKDDDYTEEGE